MKCYDRIIITILSYNIKTIVYSLSIGEIVAPTIYVYVSYTSRKREREEFEKTTFLPPSNIIIIIMQRGMQCACMIMSSEKTKKSIHRKSYAKTCRVGRADRRRRTRLQLLFTTDNAAALISLFFVVVVDVYSSVRPPTLRARSLRCTRTGCRRRRRS